MAITDFPWFKIYASETLSDENFMSWTPAQRGCWFTLLCHCWKEGSIPEDTDKLSRICGLDARAFLEHWSGIAHRFPKHANIPGRLISTRLEFERGQSLDEAQNKSQHGRAGANARWNKYKTDMLGQCSGNAQDMPNDAPQPKPQPKIITTPTPSPKAQGRRPKVESLGEYPAELLEAVADYKALWKALRIPTITEQFPEDKRFIASSIGSTEAAFKAWQKRTQSQVHGEKITDPDVLDALRRVIVSKRKAAESGKQLSVPHLATVLNHDLFVDYLVKVKEVSHAS